MIILFCFFGWLFLDEYQLIELHDGVSWFFESFAELRYLFLKVENNLSLLFIFTAKHLSAFRESYHLFFKGFLWVLPLCSLFLPFGPDIVEFLLVGYILNCQSLCLSQYFLFFMFSWVKLSLENVVFASQDISLSGPFNQKMLKFNNSISI